MSWHAIFVETGKEDIVCSRISEQLILSNYQGSYELLVPKKKIQERHNGMFVEVVKKLFPGYVLVHTNEVQGIFEKTRMCKHIYRFLRIEHEFQTIQDKEIENIIKMLDNNGIIEVSNAIIENDVVKIIDGPLSDFVGHIMKIDKRKRRAKVLIKFEGKERLIDLAINIIMRC